MLSLVVLTARPITVSAGAVEREAPLERAVVTTEEPSVHYAIDASGDIVGRYVRRTGAGI